MQNKNKTALLFIGAFILGFGFFWFLNFSSKPESTPSTSNIANDATQNEKAAQKEDTVKTEVSKSKILNLSGQGLEKLPSSSLSRTDLEELNISNNKITGALPSEIGKLTNLKVLNASNNLMTGVPAEIGHLSKLEVLDLSNNKLTGLPQELAQLKNLKTLNISGNSYSQQDLDVIKKGLSTDTTIIL